jgi:hypothetical protein
MNSQFTKQKSATNGRDKGIPMWVTCAEACAFLGVSRPTIRRRRIADREGLDYVPGRIRYRDLDLGGAEAEPRYLFSDLETMLREPRTAPELTSKFHV